MSDLYNPDPWNYETFTELIQAHLYFLILGFRERPPYFQLDRSVDKWLSDSDKFLLYSNNNYRHDYLRLHHLAILPFYGQAYQFSSVLRSLPTISFAIANEDLALCMKAKLKKSRRTYFNCYRLHPFTTIHASTHPKRTILKSWELNRWVDRLNISPGLDTDLNFFNLKPMKEERPYIFEVTACNWKDIDICRKVGSIGEWFWRGKSFKFMKPPKESSPLLALPHEILLEIRKYLPLTAQAFLRCSCRGINAVIEEDVRREPFRQFRLPDSEGREFEIARDKLRSPLATFIRYFIVTDMLSTDLILSLPCCKDESLPSCTVKFQLRYMSSEMGPAISRLSGAHNLEFEVEMLQQRLDMTRKLKANDMWRPIPFRFILRLGCMFEPIDRWTECGERFLIDLIYWSRRCKTLEIVNDTTFGSVNWTYDGVVAIVDHFVRAKEGEWGNDYTPLESITITGYKGTPRNFGWWHLVQHRNGRNREGCLSFTEIGYGMYSSKGE